MINKLIKNMPGDSVENRNPIFLVLALAILTACGGGGGGSAPILDEEDEPPQNPLTVTAEGRFLDSAVSGVFYVSGNTSGTTTDTGGFTYEVGQNIRLFIGGIQFGSVAGAEVITPIELVADATGTDNDAVVNMLRFIQTLDDDDDPSNGIQITEALRAAAGPLSVDFNVTVEEFAASTNVQSVVALLTAERTAGARLLVGLLAATQHFNQTLIDLGREVDERVANLGSLILSGDAGQEAGLEFIPDDGAAGDVPPDNTEIIIRWFDDSFLPQSQILMSIEGFNDTSEDPLVIVPRKLTFVIEGEDPTYSYTLRCLVIDGQCSRINVDPVTSTVSFSDVSLGVNEDAIDNQATGDLTLNGTLSYEKLEPQ